MDDKKACGASKEHYKPVVRIDRRGRLYKTAEDLAQSPIVRERIKWLATHGDQLLSKRSTQS